MKNNKKLELEIKILKEQLEGIKKAIPVVYYDKDPSIINYAFKEFLNRYGLFKSFYIYFNKKAVSYVIEKIIYVALLWIFNKLIGGVK